MKISILAIGKAKKGAEMALFAEYCKRLPWKLNLKEIEEKKHLSGEQLKEKEGDLLLEALPKGAKLIALDERGKPISSKEFAAKISHWQQETSHLAFIIGGADGLSERVKKRADYMLSLGAMTWPHMLVRTMLAEQLYRASTILSGHPYHRE